jgi:2-iminobutanoate/2-iminopropanoate deaminase
MVRQTLRPLLLILAVVAQPLTGQEVRRHIDPRHPSDSEALPFSGAVQVGNTLYLSGTLGLEADRTVPSDPAVEARRAMDSLRSTLQAAGMDMDDLVSVQVFCSDLSLYQVFNEVYRTYFQAEFPARAFIGSGPLLYGARFEVMGVAVGR